MPRHYHDDDDEEEDDPEAPDLSDIDDDDDSDDSPTTTCAHCGNEVYEFADQCTACGQSLSDANGRRTNHPRWVITTAAGLILLMLYALIRWIFR